MTDLPEEFIYQMQAQLGADYEQFAASLQTAPPVSVRLNPRKSAALDLPFGAPVPWAAEGRYLTERPTFTLDPAFHAGAYYVQEASSMFIEFLLKSQVDFSRPLKVLDLCGAPGGKSTLLAGLLNDQSLLVANEVIKSRVGVLKENLHKWGFSNVIVSNHDAEEMVELHGFFDIVVVDAPCSGEGLFRKDEAARAEWSIDSVQHCSARQKRILKAAAQLVTDGGFLLYSTCTYNCFENDDNVAWLKSLTDLQPMPILEDTPAGVTPTQFGYQFYPHKVAGEGFYCCLLKQTFGEELRAGGKIKLNKLPYKQQDSIQAFLKESTAYDYFLKPDGTVVAVRSELLGEYATVLRGLQRRSTGLELGVLKGTELIPSHELALSTALSTEVPRIELSKENALKYLKREDFEMPTEVAKGWFIVTYLKLPLGWAKVAGNRINNYLPKDWRIRMDIS